MRQTRGSSGVCCWIVVDNSIRSGIPWLRFGWPDPGGFRFCLAGSYYPEPVDRRK
jgi:hypothetical protein